jgi:hypothetical protein
MADQIAKIQITDIKGRATGPVRPYENRMYAKKNGMTEDQR